MAVRLSSEVATDDPAAVSRYRKTLPSTPNEDPPVTTRLALLLAAVGSLPTPLLADDAAAANRSAKRPNILWIVSEDNSTFLGSYGYEDANTPRLDQLAKEGVRYEYAFANAPVCAPARCTIITGVFPPSMGTQHMRSRYRIPESIKMFPKYLREAGYYCTNDSKTDYNLSYQGGGYDETAWDAMTKGDHTKRREGQPFFAVYNIGTSHESSLHQPLDKSLFDANVQIPPYHPDVPEVRANWAMYHRILTKMDSQVGEILDKLDKDGVADDTIVLYYADHGGILTRSKRYLYDTGTHVPMIARFGRNFAHLAPSEPGSTSQRLVSFVDLAPTVLSLAGVEIPDYMQGNAFLGEKKTADPEYVHLFRGRMDERYDMMRAVRDTRFKYIRNYMPHRVYGQHLNYLWLMPLTKAWEREYKAGRTQGSQNIFWEEKPSEELYDTEADYWEVNNLAGDPQYKEVLERMRKAQREQVLAIRDSGFMPEGQMIERTAGTTTYEYVRDASKYPLEKIVAMADLATTRDTPVLKLAQGFEEADPAIHYWAATGAIVQGEGAEPLTNHLQFAMDNFEDADARLAAAEALCEFGRTEFALPLVTDLLASKNDKVALHAANVLEELGDEARPALDELKTAAKDKDYLGRSASWTVEKLTQDPAR
jgi:N-sulfoglucosamine sulfohydrolase